MSAVRFRRGSPDVEQNVDVGICVRGKNGGLLSSTSAQPMHSPVPVHTYCDVPKEGHSTQQIKIGSAGVPFFPPTFCAVLDLLSKKTAYNRETSGNSTKKSTHTPGTCPWFGWRTTKLRKNNIWIGWHLLDWQTKSHNGEYCILRGKI